jgi:hypothetical protein
MEKEKLDQNSLKNTMAVFYKSYAEKNFEDKPMRQKLKPIDMTNKFIMQTLNRKTKGIILMNELWSDSFH